MPTVTHQHVSRIESALRAGLAAKSALAASWVRSATVHHLGEIEQIVQVLHG